MGQSGSKEKSIYELYEEGVQLYKSKKYQRAEKVLMKVVETAKINKEASRCYTKALAKCQLQLEKLDEALILINQELNRYYDPTFCFLKGEVLYRQHHQEEAQKYFEIAARLRAASFTEVMVASKPKTQLGLMAIKGNPLSLSADKFLFISNLPKRCKQTIYEGRRESLNEIRNAMLPNNGFNFYETKTTNIAESEYAFFRDEENEPSPYQFISSFHLAVLCNDQSLVKLLIEHPEFKIMSPSYQRKIYHYSLLETYVWESDSFDNYSWVYKHVKTQHQFGVANEECYALKKVVFKTPLHLLLEYFCETEDSFCIEMANQLLHKGAGIVFPDVSLLFRGNANKTSLKANLREKLGGLNLKNAVVIIDSVDIDVIEWAKQKEAFVFTLAQQNNVSELERFRQFILNNGYEVVTIQHLTASINEYLLLLKKTNEQTLLKDVTEIYLDRECVEDYPAIIHQKVTRKGENKFSKIEGLNRPEKGTAYNTNAKAVVNAIKTICDEYLHQQSSPAATKIYDNNNYVNLALEKIMDSELSFYDKVYAEKHHNEYKVFKEKISEAVVRTTKQFYEKKDSQFYHILRAYSGHSQSTLSPQLESAIQEIYQIHCEINKMPFNPYIAVQLTVSALIARLRGGFGQFHPVQVLLKGGEELDENLSGCWVEYHYKSFNKFLTKVNKTDFSATRLLLNADKFEYGANGGAFSILAKAFENEDNCDMECGFVKSAHHVHTLSRKAFNCLLQFSLDEANDLLQTLLEYAKEVSSFYEAHTYYWLSLSSLLATDFDKAQEWIQLCIATTQNSIFYTVWAHSEEYYALYAIIIMIKDDSKYEKAISNLKNLSDNKKDIYSRYKIPMFESMLGDICKALINTQSAPDELLVKIQADLLSQCCNSEFKKEASVPFQLIGLLQGIFLRYLKHYSAAQKHWEAVLKEDEANSLLQCGLHYHAGKNIFLQGDVNAALEHLTKAKEEYKNQFQEDDRKNPLIEQQLQVITSFQEKMLTLAHRITTDRFEDKNVEKKLNDHIYKELMSGFTAYYLDFSADSFAVLWSSSCIYQSLYNKGEDWNSLIEELASETQLSDNRKEFLKRCLHEGFAKWKNSYFKSTNSIKKSGSIPSVSSSTAGNSTSASSSSSSTPTVPISISTNPVTPTGISDTRNKEFFIADFKCVLEQAYSLQLDILLEESKQDPTNEKVKRWFKLSKILQNYNDYFQKNPRLARIAEKFIEKNIIKMAAKLNWTGTLGYICGSLLKQCGLKKDDDNWLDILRTDMQEAYHASQRLIEFYQSYTNEPIKLALYLLNHTELKNFLENDSNRTKLGALLAGLDVPGLTKQTSEELFQLVINLQVWMQQKNKKEIILDDIILFGVEAVHQFATTDDGSDKLSLIISKLNLLVKALQSVITVFTAPMLGEVEFALTPLVLQLFEEARKGISQSKLIDCSKIFVSYTCEDLGGLLDAFTPSLQRIRAKNLSSISFGQDGGVFLFDSFLLEGFDFTNARFINCSFKKTKFINCNFTNAIFLGNTDIQSAVIDNDTAKTLNPALRCAELSGSKVQSPCNLGSHKVSAPDVEFPKDKCKASEEDTEESSLAFGTEFLKGTVSVAKSTVSSGLGFIKSCWDNLPDVAAGLADNVETMEAEGLNELNKIHSTQQKAIASLEKTIEQLKKEVSTTDAMHAFSLEQHESELQSARKQLGEFQTFMSEINVRRKEKELIGQLIKYIMPKKTLVSFYKTLLTRLSAYFATILILNTDLVEVQKHAILDLVLEQQQPGWLQPCLFNLVKLTEVASRLTSNLAFIPNVGWIIDSVSSCVHTISTSVETKIEEKIISDGCSVLSGYSITGLDKLTNQIALFVTLAYEEQIELLTINGAATFANTGASKIMAGLLNGYISPGETMQTDLLTVLHNVKQSSHKVPLIRMSFGVQTVEVKNKADKGITDDMLYRGPGCRVRVGNTHHWLYYSNDDSPLSSIKKTFAAKVGYIKTAVFVDAMSLDLERRGPKSVINNKSVVSESTLNPKEYFLYGCEGHANAITFFKCGKYQEARGKVAFAKTMLGFAKKRGYLQEEVKEIEDKLAELEQSLQQSDSGSSTSSAMPSSGK